MEALYKLLNLVETNRLKVGSPLRDTELLVLSVGKHSPCLYCLCFSFMEMNGIQKLLRRLGAASHMALYRSGRNTANRYNCIPFSLPLFVSLSLSWCSLSLYLYISLSLYTHIHIYIYIIYLSCRWHLR